MALALILRFTFTETKSVSLEKIVHNYLYLDSELQTTIDYLLGESALNICSVFVKENSKIDPSSKTHKVLSELFFHDLLFSKIKESFFQTPKGLIEHLKKLILSFNNPKGKKFIETILDRKDVEDLEKLGLIDVLLELSIETGWQNIVSFHSKSSNFSVIKDSYFTLINSTLNKKAFLKIKPENIVIRDEDFSFFRNLVFEENDTIAKDAIFICSFFNFSDIETTIEDRLNLTRNSSYIENACLNSLLKIHSKNSCKVIYHYIMSNEKHDSSSTLQFAFKTLNEMGVLGRPYLVLLARSDEPFVRVMAKSYLHSD